MHTIVVNSQKGGSGKTTLCAHLSVQAQRAGDGEVFLIDTDPQGTLTTWHEKREAEAPRRVELSFGGRPPRPEGRGFHAPGWLRCGPAGATSFPPRPEGRGFSEDLDEKRHLGQGSQATCRHLGPDRFLVADGTPRLGADGHDPGVDPVD